MRADGRLDTSQRQAVLLVTLYFLRVDRLFLDTGSSSKTYVCGLWNHIAQEALVST